MNTILTLVVFFNLIIVGGYLFISKEIAPKLKVTRKATIYGGIAFFMLCAATHLEEALHAFSEGNIWTLKHAIVMLAIAVAQAVAVVVFIYGLYREFVLPGLPLIRRHGGKGSRVDSSRDL